jgi:hypothetical protein
MDPGGPCRFEQLNEDQVLEGDQGDDGCVV